MLCIDSIQNYWMPAEEWFHSSLFSLPFIASGCAYGVGGATIIMRSRKPFSTGMFLDFSRPKEPVNPQVVLGQALSTFICLNTCLFAGLDGKTLRAKLNENFQQQWQPVINGLCMQVNKLQSNNSHSAALITRLAQHSSPFTLPLKKK